MKQNPNKNYSIFIYMFTLTMCILAANISIPTAAKATAASKKLTISQSSVKMAPTAKKKLTIKNARKKVKWSSSNRKVAVIASKSGKYKNKAVIQAKKAGTCTITIKSGSLKRKCKVRVLKNEDSHNNTKTGSGNKTDSNDNLNADASTDSTTAGIQFESVSATKNSIAVTVKVYNNTEQQIYYGLGCCIEKQTDGNWSVLETTEPMVVPAIACIVKANSSQSQTFQITKLKEPVTGGNYRITLSEMSKPEPPLLMKVINTATFQITDIADTGTTPASSEPAITTVPSNTPAPAIAPTPAIAPVPSSAPALPVIPTPEISPEETGVRMSLSDISYSDNRISVKMTVQNNTPAGASLSRNYGFEKWEDGNWQPVIPKEPLIVTCDMIALPAYGQFEEVCTIVTKETLTAGSYRFVRPGIFCEDPDAVIEKTAEFVVQ